jgi:peptide-methionine (S)-S-oxide reductase
MSKEVELADFGGGCFWGVEEVFRAQIGVVKTAAGYEGGHVDNPTYEQVSSHTTGHAETVQISYDPSKISYEKLLDLFFEHHDPTQVNRQGPDEGENYRSVIFYHNDEQKEQAEAKIEKLEKSGNFGKPIATMVVPASTFWLAEDYHQQYLHKRNLNVCY